MGADSGAIRLHLTWRQSAFVMVLGSLLVVQRMLYDPLGTGTILFTTAWIALLLLDRWCGVTLTPDAAIVRNLRRQVVPWSAVRDITVEYRACNRTVMLWEAGRRTRLRAPLTGPLMRDPHFDEKYRLIVDYRLARGEDGWAPSPPPGHYDWVPPYSRRHS